MTGTTRPTGTGVPGPVWARNWTSRPSTWNRTRGRYEGEPSSSSVTSCPTTTPSALAAPVRNRFPASRRAIATPMEAVPATASTPPLRFTTTSTPADRPMPSVAADRPPTRRRRAIAASADEVEGDAGDDVEQEDAGLVEGDPGDVQDVELLAGEREQAGPRRVEATRSRRGEGRPEEDGVVEDRAPEEELAGRLQGYGVGSVSVRRFTSSVA